MVTRGEIIIRLLLSIILASVIGIDRESTKKPAGLRTHILVSLGSTLIMLLSIYQPKGFQGSLDNSYRLSAQVISGIGFLGAGTILRSESGGVTGLTTAASLWVVAAIGLSVGAGFYLGAILTTLFVFIILISLAGIEEKIFIKNKAVFKLNISSYKNIIVIEEIYKIFSNYDKNISKLSVDTIDKYNHFYIEAFVFEDNVRMEIINDLYNIDGVIKIKHKN